jgi:hypothetical protein
MHRGYVKEIERMFGYEDLKVQPGKFLSPTRLTMAEFEDFPPTFEKAYLNRYPVLKKKQARSAQEKQEQALRAHPRAQYKTAICFGLSMASQPGRIIRNWAISSKE